MRSVILSIWLLLSFAAIAPAAFVDFEDLSGQAALPSNYAGLLWSDGWEYYDWSQPPFTASSGVVRVYNNDGSSPPRFAFSSPVLFNGVYFAGEGSAQYELWLGGLLVANSATVALSSVPTFLSSGYGGLIDEVRLTGIVQGRFVMDDVTYDGGAGAVPEPATFGFIGLGLAGVLFLRRRSA